MTGAKERSLLVISPQQLVVWNLRQCERHLMEGSEDPVGLVYVSIFAALLPASPPIWLVLSLPPLLFLVETTWYGVVALAISSSRPRAYYLEFKVVLDRVAGMVLGALGLRLVAEAVCAQRP